MNDKINSFLSLKDKWTVISIHGDVTNIPLTEKSYVWCNGLKIKDFTSRSSTGSTQMTY